LSQPTNNEAPDYVGCITGYRAWMAEVYPSPRAVLDNVSPSITPAELLDATLTFSCHNETGRLRSVSMAINRDTWLQRQEAVAHCLCVGIVNEEKPLSAMSDKEVACHTCGLYCCKTVDDALNHAGEWIGAMLLGGALDGFRRSNIVREFVHVEQMGLAYDRSYLIEAETIPIIGEVALWGTVIEHEHGYRAEFAYPTKFYYLSMDRVFFRTPSGVPGRTFVDGLGREYGVPVELRHYAFDWPGTHLMMRRRSVP
jgi:hypothetical protein